MWLYLVRHGRTIVDPAMPAAQWGLDSAAHAEVVALRPRLPTRATWTSSPERKSIETVRLLTAEPVEIDADLRECERPWHEDPAAFEVAVARTFAAPRYAALPGWETAADALRRLDRAVSRLHERGLQRAVLVGHGTAWTLLLAQLSGRRPTLADWSRLRMPDLRTVEYPPVSALDVRGEVGKG